MIAPEMLVDLRREVVEMRDRELEAVERLRAPVPLPPPPVALPALPRPGRLRRLLLALGMALGLVERPPKAEHPPRPWSH